jgi:hypothetical protein
MKSLQKIPPSMIEPDADRTMPPGGGLLIAVGASFLFWGALVWLVL